MSGLPNRYHRCRQATLDVLHLQKKLMGTSTVVLVQTVPNSRTRYVPSDGASGLILNTRSAAILWRDGNNNLAIVTSTDVRHQGHVVRHIVIQISLLKKEIGRAHV